MGSTSTAGPRVDDTARTSRPGPSAEVGDRFAAHVGVQVDEFDDSHCTCGATAVLTSAPWLDRDGHHQESPRGEHADDTAVPTGAVLALVDAVARRAADVAAASSGRRVHLVATATGIQFRGPAAGRVTATASVPCEGVLVDRADDQGAFRFSVAVDVVDDGGDRVATGTVQWRGHLDDESPTVPDG